jgi:aerobic C4-dicarboxylate transport protein
MHRRLDAESDIEADEPEVVLDQVATHMPAAETTVTR